jgi:nucleoid-associated protein YgaU
MRTAVVALLLLTGAALAGCAQKQAPEPAAATPVAAPLQPTPGLKANERLQLAIKSLQNGDADRAQVELNAFVGDQPRNRVGTGLLAQIETPIEKYYPRDSFPLTLKSGESLSTVAQTYLGDPLQFYALARYNQIQNPSRVTVGQSIRVPKTPAAVAALAKGPVAAAPARAEVPAPPADAALDPLPPAPSMDDPRRAAAQGR